MAIVLISWVCISMVICLAFLAAAARPLPRMDEEMAAGSETSSQEGVSAALQKGRLAPQPSQGAIPSHCQLA
jgi:hypothetical protein